MTSPAVSILMSVSDGTYLDAALESLLAQTFGDFELIVVNDAAGEEAARTLDRFAAADGRVTRIDAPDRIGLAAALNLGLAACRAPLIARADADDVYHPDRLQRQLPHFDARPDLCALSCGYRKIDAAGRVLETVPAIEGPDLVRFRLMFLNQLLHPGIVFRRAAVDRVGGYDPRYWTAQDTDLWARLSSLGELDNVAEPLVDWRRHGRSTLQSRGDPGAALGATISARLQSHYLNRSVPMVTAFDARHTWRSFEPLPPNVVFAGERILAEIHARARERETAQVVSDLERTVAAALLRQAGWSVRRAPETVPELTWRALQWRRGRPAPFRSHASPVAPPDPGDEPQAAQAAPHGPAATHGSHALPRFEGRQSRHHRRVSITRLRAEAMWDGVTKGRIDATVFAQFVGFPRSGHSLVGTVLDAQDGILISHELDAMGLFAKGLSMSRIARLIARNAEAFSRNGRWWNGLSYDTGGERDRRAETLDVIGDKKGDWVARWAARDPDLIDRFSAATRMRCKWILVTRHPFDNVATMTLRKGGVYDRLRIDAASGGDFRDTLAREQRDGRVASRASDAMIEDYRALCASVAEIKARVPPDDWVEIVYEDFARDPVRVIGDLLAFLGVRTDRETPLRGTDLVRSGMGRSRDRVTWSDRQRQLLRDTIKRRDFLEAYADDI